MTFIKTCALCVALLLACLLPHPASAQTVWRAGYYNSAATPGTAFPYSYYTHIVFVNYGCSAGNLLDYIGSTGNWATIRSNATANGVKLLIDIGPDDFSSCISNQTNFVNQIAGVVNGTSAPNVVLDGVALDWEGNVSAAPYEGLIAALRTKLGAGKQIVVAGWAGALFRDVILNQQANLDRFFNEEYDFASLGGYPSNNSGQHWSWYNLATTSNGLTNSGSANEGLQYFVAAGFPAAKIATGIPYYGYLYTGCTHSEVVGCAFGGTQYHYYDIRNNSTWWNSPHLNDATNGADYISLPASNQYVTYADTTEIGQLVNWGTSVGIGGYFVFVVNGEYLSSQTTQATRHPLSFALFTDSASGGTPPSISSFTASPSTIAPGGSSTLAWVTSGATTLTLNPGAITVTGTTSRVVTPAATTTYVLTATNASGSTPASATVTVSSAPAAYWKLDDGTGAVAIDSSGNAHTMAVTNSPTWLSGTSCVILGCLSFNGTNQYGSVNLDLSSTNVITIEFWMNWAAFANDDKVAFEFSPNYNSSATGFIVLPNESGSGQFQVGLFGDVGYNQANFPRPSTGIWHNYAFVLDKSKPAATEITPYVDGVAVIYTKPNASENTNNFGNNPFYVMSRAGTSLFGAGTLDDVHIYPRALSPAEISAFANIGSTGTSIKGAILHAISVH